MQIDLEVKSKRNGKIKVVELKNSLTVSKSLRKYVTVGVVVNKNVTSDLAFFTKNL